MDVLSIAVLLSLSTTILSSQEYTDDCSVADNDVYTVGETVHGHREKSSGQKSTTQTFGISRQIERLVSQYVLQQCVDGVA